MRFTRCNLIAKWHISYLYKGYSNENKLLQQKEYFSSPSSYFDLLRRSKSISKYKCLS